MDPEKKRSATKNAARCTEESFCVFVSGTYVAACSLFMSMSAASRRP